MKKSKIILAALLLALILTACGGYVSSYSALGLVRTNTARAASMSFYSLKGRMVFKLTCTDGSSIKYAASLESGTASVYIDSGDGQTQLFKVDGGDDIDGSTDRLESGTVYIIVETEGKCKNGEFRFEVEN